MRRVLLFIIAAVVCLALVFTALQLFSSRPLAPHVGDGQFRDISFHHLGMRIRGYSIQFPDFDLSANHETTFRFRTLPEIGKDIGIYLCVHDPNDQWTDDTIQTLKSTFRFELQDADGKVVASLDRPISELTWSTHDRYTHALYSLEDSFFTPTLRKRYTLTVRYVPDPEFPRSTGFVYMRCGGSL